MSEPKGIPKIVSELLKGYPDTLDIYLRFVKPINFLLVYVLGVTLSTIASSGNTIFYSILMIAWLYVMIFVLGGIWGFDVEDVMTGNIKSNDISVKKKEERVGEKLRVARERKPIKLSKQQVNIFLVVMGFVMILLSSYVSFISYLQLGFVLCGVVLIVTGFNGISSTQKKSNEVLKGEEY